MYSSIIIIKDLDWFINGVSQLLQGMDTISGRVKIDVNLNVAFGSTSSNSC